MEAEFENQKKLTFIFCAVTCLIIFLFFFHTLNYPWRYFDEDIIYNETILPVPTNFKELFEIIKSFGLNNHFEASNPFYSNVSNIRGTPVSTLFTLFIFCILKKSAFAYHVFSLFFHLVNSCLLFLVLNRVNINSKIPAYIKLCLISLLTLIWALHSVNIESILFATNFGAPITYFFCLLFIFYFVKNNKEETLSIYKSVALFFLYLFPLFLNEYSVTLPIILFFYLSGLLALQNPSYTLKQCFTTTFKRTAPLFLALLVFIVYFLTSQGIKSVQVNNTIITLERVLWLSPQIFVHFLKLIFFPINLSIDQSALVQLSKSTFEPYTVFCSVFMYGLILLSIISIFLLRRKGFFCFFILFVPFFLSLSPFLHLFSPVYNLAGERYLYFPLLLIVLGISHVMFFMFSRITHGRDAVNRVSTFIVLFLVIISGVRSYYRTLDWKDSISLLQSTIKTAPNDLYKGLRLEMIASSLRADKNNLQTSEILRNSNEAIISLEKALGKFQEDRKRYQDTTPQILKFYGLDPKTLEAKTAFLLAYTNFNLTGDVHTTYNIIAPYINDINPLDTTILDFYYKILFNTGNIDKAEELLNNSLREKRFSPILFVALSDLHEYKYNDLKSTEKYLNKSFKIFPYAPITLFGLKRLYQKLNNPEKFAYFSYLYGLRTHSDNLKL